jgi:hypothetical protein
VLGFNGRRSNRECDVGPTGLSVFTTAIYAPDANGLSILEQGTFSGASTDIVVPIQNVSLLRSDFVQPLFTINLELEAGSDIVNPLSLPLSAWLLAGGMMPLMYGRRRARSRDILAPA